MKSLYKLDKRIKVLLTKYEINNVIRRITRMIRQRLTYLNSLSNDLICIQEGYMYVYQGNDTFDVYRPDDDETMKAWTEMMFLFAARKKLSYLPKLKDDQ
jgi:hypothetical protein